MKTIYLDSEFKCNLSEAGALTAVEISVFDGKCDAFIEGYRYIPEGETWIRSDNVSFTGEMAAPWKPYEELAAAQVQYEADLAALDAAYREGVNSV